ncbi:MAG TPA: quinolinate synthase NadA [Candidatus Thermoplasmatota archaeon]|nr:quinolinate synthase NadA [Candidatus Thermoplasmatota archaeon]
MSLMEVLPESYASVGPDERARRMAAAKAALGKDLVILGHNYQQDDVIRWADFVGDSYGLSVEAARTEAKHIVFCGVTFMAETADILTDGRRNVIMPSMEASCPMAGMAEMVQVQSAWDQLETVLGPDALVPVTYMNSYADLKAFTGEKGGLICTSSNAHKAMKWALDTGKKVVFLPDKHLGHNTAHRLGVKDSEIARWNAWNRDFGGLTEEAVRDARVILWEGFCQVHDRFKLSHVEEIKREHPGIRILVHPECRREVVAAADAFGSTTEMAKIIEDSPPGTKWAVGTEIHMVRRLAKENPDKYVVQLCGELCLDCNAMRQVDPNYLLWVTESLAYEGRVINRIATEPEERAGAKLALERMLAL